MCSQNIPARSEKPHNVEKKLGNDKRCTQTGLRSFLCSSDSNRSHAAAEFPCSQNALLLPFCLTGARLELGPCFYTLSLLSKSTRACQRDSIIHTSLTLIVSGRNCYSGWRSPGAADLGSGEVGRPAHAVVGSALLPDENLLRFV